MENHFRRMLGNRMLHLSEIEKSHCRVVEEVVVEGRPKLYFVEHCLERVQVQVVIEKNVGGQRPRYVTNYC